MNQQSQYLREQARRAQRLAESISDDQASQTLKSLAKEYEDDANRIEQSNSSA